MHVVEHPGDAGAPVVLLIHGLLDSGASFDGVVRELVPEHTVVTYDRRGWGRSRGDAPPRSLAEQADDAVAALDGRRATVVGHSYGGVVGLDDRGTPARPRRAHSPSSSPPSRGPTGGPTTTR